jgi:hypothetical protein
MPNMHHPGKVQVAYRIRREIVHDAKARATERGETLTDVVERAFREYAACGSK